MILPGTTHHLSNPTRGPPTRLPDDSPFGFFMVLSFYSTVHNTIQLHTKKHFAKTTVFGHFYVY